MRHPPREALSREAASLAARRERRREGLGEAGRAAGAGEGGATARGPERRRRWERASSSEVSKVGKEAESAKCRTGGSAKRDCRTRSRRRRKEERRRRSAKRDGTWLEVEEAFKE